jgi:hypothetical protein
MKKPFYARYMGILSHPTPIFGACGAFGLNGASHCTHECTVHIISGNLLVRYDSRLWPFVSWSTTVPSKNVLPWYN